MRQLPPSASCRAHQAAATAGDGTSAHRTQTRRQTRTQRLQETAPDTARTDCTTTPATATATATTQPTRPACLEDVRELRLSVRHVGASLRCQRDDDLLQVAQRLVDVHRLAKDDVISGRGTVVQRLLDALRAREVHEVQLRHEHLCGTRRHVADGYTRRHTRTRTRTRWQRRRTRAADEPMRARCEM